MKRPELIEVKGPFVTGEVLVDGAPFPFPIVSVHHSMSARGGLPTLVVEIEADRITIDHHSIDPGPRVKTLVFALNQRDAKIAADKLGVPWRACIYVSHASVLRRGTPGAPRIQASSYPERRDYLEIEEHLRILDATVAAPPEPTVVPVWPPGTSSSGSSR